MGYFLVLNSYAGDNQDVAAKKLAMMFRMAPQQAQAVVDQVSKGKVWQFKNKISDQQAALAESYLKGIGFQVQRAGAQQEMVDRIVDTAALEKSSGTAVQKHPSSQTKTEALVPADPKPAGKALYFGFHGNGSGLFKIHLVNWILSSLTLGIYYFWGKTNERKYLWEQTSFTGDRFQYHGTGGELFKGAALFNIFIVLLVLGVELIQSTFGAQMAGVANVVLVLGIWIAIPAILVGAYRYRLARTSWRGIRFSFRGTRKKAVGLYVKGFFLTIISLGLYWPYFTVQRREFWMEHSYFGSEHARYKGEGKDLFGKYLLALFLVPLTAGIYWFWYQAFVARYNWGKTRFAGGRFSFNATGGQMLSLNLVNFLLLILTLGMAMPWVVARNAKFVTEHLAVSADMMLDKVVQDARASGSIGEGAADGMDVDIDIGF